MLYYAKISPLRKVKSLTLEESEKLYEGLRIISRLDYNYGGLSLKNFSVNGVKGNFQDYLKVYKNPRAILIKTVDGRGTWWNKTEQF